MQRQMLTDSAETDIAPGFSQLEMTRSDGRCMAYDEHIS